MPPEPPFHLDAPSPADKRHDSVLITHSSTSFCPTETVTEERIPGPASGNSRIAAEQNAKGVALQPVVAQTASILTSVMPSHAAAVTPFKSSSETCDRRHHAATTQAADPCRTATSLGNGPSRGRLPISPDRGQNVLLAGSQPHRSDPVPAGREVAASDVIITSPSGNSLIITTNPAAMLQGFGGLRGAQYDANSARQCLRAARANLLNIRRNHLTPPAGPMAREIALLANYPFWRKDALARVLRCKREVRRAEAEVRALLAQRQDTHPERTV